MKLLAKNHRPRIPELTQLVRCLSIFHSLGRSCALKSKAKTEMERADIFARLPIGIKSIVEPDGTDWQFVTQAAAKRVMHVVYPRFLGCGQEISRVEKERALQLAQKRKSVLDVKDGKKLTADRVAFWIMRPKVAFAITAHGSGAAVEETFVDRNSGRLIRAGVVQRMNEPGARTDSEQ